MAQDGEINLSEVKAKYSVNDIHLVDAREIDLANEFRLTYEISLAIGLTIGGNLISNFEWITFAAALAFCSFGGIHIYRYRNKVQEIKSVQPDTNSHS